MIFYFLVGLAMAQEDDRTIQYQKRTEIDFEALDIEGEMIKPQGSLLMERQKTKFNPLIELRTDWNHEMASFVQEIK